MSDYPEFPKIPRLSRECVITEKIDGTNAQIYFDYYDSDHADPPNVLTTVKIPDWSAYVFAGSRTRWLSLEQDNYGFAKWVYDHAQELVDGLGMGRHYGEWWGSGINRGYGLEKGEKRFSLFNTKRWKNDQEPDTYWHWDKRTQVPDCCTVVPIIASGIFSSELVDVALTTLKSEGSYASPGFMRPEGIIIYHTAGNSYWKKTLEKDDEYKGKNK